MTPFLSRERKYAKIKEIRYERMILMSEKTVLTEKRGAIAIVTLNRPKNLNALSADLVSECLLVLHTLEHDDAVRVVVLTGAGRAFCAGGDLGSLDALSTADERRRFIAKAATIAKLLAAMSKPVIAMVNGVAAGAGFNLALACDLAYAAEGVRFIQSFANVGLSPDCGGFYFLPKTVGLAKAKELMFTSRPVDAAEAKALGIVNDVYPPEELKKKVMATAEAIAAKAPLGIAMTKKAVNNYGATLDETLTFEEMATSMLLGTEDFREGVRSFNEKRPPKFQGK